jgi:hypothetical protein
LQKGVPVKTTYPAKDFTKVVRSALATGESWSVVVSSPWRLRRIMRSISIWPAKLHEPLNGSSDERRAYIFCMVLMPTLMTMHSSSISVGYKMTYEQVDSSAIEITYSWTA